MRCGAAGQLCGVWGRVLVFDQFQESGLGQAMAGERVGKRHGGWANGQAGRGIMKAMASGAERGRRGDQAQHAAGQVHVGWAVGK